MNKIVYENPDKNYQYRLTVSEFKDVEYLHLRRYYQSFEGDWVPSSEGASIPLSIPVVVSLLEGLVALCSNAEADEELRKFFKDNVT